MARVFRSRLEPARMRIARLLERLGRTSFRDSFEREILVGELGRTIGELPSAGGAATAFVAEEDGELAGDSLEALAAVERAFRALEEPESSHAWAHRLERLDGCLARLLAAEGDVLEACEAYSARPPAAEAEARLLATA